MWKSVHPLQGGAPLSAGGLDALTGLPFHPAVLDVFGGCPDDAMNMTCRKTWKYFSPTDFKTFQSPLMPQSKKV